jgi:hypothetical protein
MWQAEVSEYIPAAALQRGTSVRFLGHVNFAFPGGPALLHLAAGG